MSKKFSSDCQKWNVIEDKQRNLENFKLSIFESKDWKETKWEFKHDSIKGRNDELLR
jgi:hypothetical protein